MVHSSTALPLLRGVPIPMTWEEFLAWPAEGKTEWVDGEGIAYVPNNARHVRLVVFLADLLGRYLRTFGLGEVMIENMIVRLSTRPSGRAPDLFIVGSRDRERVHETWVDGPVPLAIEIVSEDSVERDTVEKRVEYERAGISEYLIVEARPGRRGISLLRLDAGGRYQPVQPDADGCHHLTTLPGFWLDPNWLDQDPLPDPERLMLRIAPEAYRRYLVELLSE